MSQFCEFAPGVPEVDRAEASTALGEVVAKVACSRASDCISGNETYCYVYGCTPNPPDSPPTEDDRLTTPMGSIEVDLPATHFLKQLPVEVMPIDDFGL